MNEYITDELIETTYLFCVKRITDTEEAKDLSQDILYEALRVIASGKQFYSFTSWYWKMARNKYADYVAHKQNAALPLQVSCGMATEAFCPIESMIATEDVSQLNYSLSRLAAIHREILIRFYLKEHSVKQIAQELSIPEGTVKRRLFDAKKNLKERFETMNNVGKSAYAPADVSWFWGFSAGKASHVMNSSKICPQVMVICRNEPKTLNEIADEMGIAPVYLEEIVEKMLHTDLLTAVTRGKYVANHCVFPKDKYAQAKVLACKIFHDDGYGDKINRILWELKDQITSLPFYGNDFDYAYLLWIWYVIAAHAFGEQGRNHYIEKLNIKDEAEREYRLTMEYTLADENFDASVWQQMKERNWSNLHQGFHTAEYGHLEFVNDYEMAPFPDEEKDDDWRAGRDKWVDGSNISLLVSLSENPERELSVYEQAMAAGLQKNGLLRKENNKLIVQMPIFSREVYHKIDGLIAEKMKDIAQEYADQVGQAVAEILWPYVRKELRSNFAHWDMQIFLQQIGALFYYGWDQQLAQPEDYACSAAGLYIIK